MLEVDGVNSLIWYTDIHTILISTIAIVHVLLYHMIVMEPAWMLFSTLATRDACQSILYLLHICM